MKTLVALRHLAFEDLGLLAPLMQAQGWRVHYYDLGVDELWKIDLSQVDLLVILGGPIGAEDDERYPFLVDELQLLRERLAANQTLADADTVISLRWAPIIEDLNAKWRLRHDGVIYNIVGAANVGMRNREFEVLCVSGMNDG